MAPEEVKAVQDGSKPTFDITQSRYDTKTYIGRLKHFTSVTSPLTLFASKQQLMDAEKLLEEYRDGVGKGRQAWGKEEEMGIWKAKQLVDSSLHPDTKEPIYLPFRLSAFVPTNLLIVGGMLMPNPTIKGVIFWQWANQSLNVCVNYANANKSISMSNQEIATAYLSATAASCTIAVGLSQLVPRLRRLSPNTRTLLAKFVPFAAVASAGCVNIALMRWKEIRDGIAIYPPSDPMTGAPAKESIGTSSKAGELAIAQTAASRVLTNIPTLILPPLVITMLEKRGAFKGPRGKTLSTVANLGLIGTSLLVFLPPAIATFPQRGSISPLKLEKRFHELPYEKVEFSKGL